MSHKPTAPLVPDELKVRRQKEIEHACQEHKKALDAQRDRDRLVAAGNLVQDFGSAFELEQKADKEYLTRWVKVVAAYRFVLDELEQKADELEQGDEKHWKQWAKVVLVERGMLDRLAQPPAGILEQHPDAWRPAMNIFLAADTAPDRAAAELADLAATDPALAVEVARCLRRDIRAVAEGFWLDPVPQPPWPPAPSEPASEPTTENADASATDESPARLLRRVGKVWHLRYRGEKADFPVGGNKFLGWLAKLLMKPDYGWTVAELHGDPDGKLRADASLGGERVSDKEGLRAIWKRIEDIDSITEEAGDSEELENEKAELLRRVERHSAKEGMEASVSKAYNNITTLKRQFLQKLRAEMPQLTSHLKACIIPSGNDYTISYRPPVGTPRWDIENPTA